MKFDNVKYISICACSTWETLTYTRWMAQIALLQCLTTNMEIRLILCELNTHRNTRTRVGRLTLLQSMMIHRHGHVALLNTQYISYQQQQSVVYNSWWDAKIASAWCSFHTENTFNVTVPCVRILFCIFNKWFASRIDNNHHRQHRQHRQWSCTIRR